MTRADRKRLRQMRGLRRSVRDKKLIEAALRAGICPCQSEAEDPGPDHLPTCPWSDPEYDGGGV